MHRCITWLWLLGIAICCVLPRPALSGTFHDPGVSAFDLRLRTWATGVVDYLPANGAESNANHFHALGQADGLTVSLGDRQQNQLSAGLTAGTVTVEMSAPFRDGPGWDLAVFENAFAIASDGALFAELAYVEVSSNGVDFARFSPTSLTTARVDYGFGTAFSGTQPGNLHNLAGKHTTLTGTTFDLADLRSSDLVHQDLLDLQTVRFVRLVDIPGSASFAEPLLDADGNIAFPDALGNPILDPWDTTASGTAGFDLDAVGARWSPSFLGTAALFNDQSSVPEYQSSVPEPAMWRVSGLLGLVCLWCQRSRQP